MSLRLLAWERRRQWEFSSTSLESNRKSSTCKYLPGIWSVIKTFDHIWCSILTNTKYLPKLPKEPELLRDLSHKHNCKQLPYFEDFIFSKKLEGDENSSKTGLTSKMLNLTFFSWEHFQHLASSTRPGNRKIEMQPSMRKDNFKIVEWSFPTFAHSLFRYKSPLWLGSLPIFMLTCKITLSERGILNLKFQNECQQARQWNESLHKAVRIFLPELETQKNTQHPPKVVFDFFFQIDCASLVT